MFNNLTTSAVLRAARRFSAKRAKAMGYGPARKFVVKLAGRVLPSKAVVGLALNVRSSQFSGGAAHVGRALARLGIRLVDIATTVALIACSAAKRCAATKAGDLYTGDFFVKARAYAEQWLGGFAVLSALHGLLDPEQVVAPYDKRLGSAAERRAWAARVTEQLRAAFPAGTTFVAFAGKDYVDGLDVDLLTPLAGMGLGHRKQWLAAQAV